MDNDPIEIRVPWGQIILAGAIFFASVAMFAMVMAYLEDRKSEAVPIGMLRLDSLDRVLKWKLDSMGMER
jgi:hypothetical protein